MSRGGSLSRSAFCNAATKASASLIRSSTDRAQIGYGHASRCLLVHHGLASEAMLHGSEPPPYQSSFLRFLRLFAAILGFVFPLRLSVFA
jgi:hypothetical protein